MYSISIPGVTFSEILFFRSTTIEWNKLDHDIRISDSLNVFMLSYLKFVRPVAIAYLK